MLRQNTKNAISAFALVAFTATGCATTPAQNSDTKIYGNVNINTHVTNASGGGASASTTICRDDRNNSIPCGENELPFMGKPKTRDMSNDELIQFAQKLIDDERELQKPYGNDVEFYSQHVRDELRRILLDRRGESLTNKKVYVGPRIAPSHD